MVNIVVGDEESWNDERSAKACLPFRNAPAPPLSSRPTALGCALPPAADGRWPMTEPEPLPSPRQP